MIGRGQPRYFRRCMFMFNVLTPENAIAKRKCKFLRSVVASDNIIYYVLCALIMLLKTYRPIQLFVMLISKDLFSIICLPFL